jgi:hypothetical protein
MGGILTVTRTFTTRRITRSRKAGIDEGDIPVIEHWKRVVLGAGVELLQNSLLGEGR